MIMRIDNNVNLSKDFIRTVDNFWYKGKIKLEFV